MEEIRKQLVELLRKAVAFHSRDEYIPAKELKNLSDIWEQLRSAPGGEPGLIRVVMEGDVEKWAK